MVRYLRNRVCHAGGLRLFQLAHEPVGSVEPTENFRRQIAFHFGALRIFPADHRGRPDVWAPVRQRVRGGMVALPHGFRGFFRLIFPEPDICPVPVKYRKPIPVGYKTVFRGFFFFS